MGVRVATVGGPRKRTNGKVSMGVLHFRYRERRRTLRVALSVPVIVHGQSESGEKFCVRCITRAVNQQGALLALEEPVVEGQPLLIVNENTNRSADVRVVYIKREHDGQQYVGLEFLSADTNFWKMTFPAPGARPLRRAIASASAKAMA